VGALNFQKELNELKNIIFDLQTLFNSLIKNTHMNKISLFILLTLLSLNCYSMKIDSLGLKYSIRAGASYHQFSPYGTSQIYKLMRYRLPSIATINPMIGISTIKTNIFKNYCCDFLRLEAAISVNRSELITFFPDDINKKSVSAFPVFFYSTLYTQYGLMAREKWRLGPVLGMTFQTGNIIKESDKIGLEEFGIYDHRNGFTQNFKHFDLSLGFNIGYKLTSRLLIQADIHYGILPQIILPRLPKIYQVYPQLTAGYIFNNTHKQKS
jgi:hypothetical protein